MSINLSLVNSSNLNILSLSTARLMVGSNPDVLSYKSFLNVLKCPILILKNTMYITKFIDKKNKVLRMHKTEYFKYDQEAWIDSVNSLAKYR